VVAVSPEKPELLKMTQEKTAASFTLLYDEDYQISEAFDVVFLSDENTLNIYNSRLGANLKDAHSDQSQRLPIPATFIIDQDRKVIWRHVNPDYKQRATTAEILKVLDRLQ